MVQEVIKSENIYVKMLNKLYVGNYLTSSELIPLLRDVCATCGRIKQIKKLFSSLKSIGVNVLPDIMVHKLRFKIVVAVINVKKVRRCLSLTNVSTLSPYVRSIAISFPKKIILTLYVPEKADIYDILGEYRDSYVYVYDYVVRSKPIPEYLFMLIEGLEKAFYENIFSSCLENSLNLPEDWEKRPRITSLTLHILDFLSLNPTLTISEVKDEVSKRVNKEFESDKIKRYVRNASKFIYGYRISVSKAPYVSRMKLCVLITNTNNNASRFCLSVIRHPLSLTCSWSNQGNIIACFSLPEIGLAEFVEQLYQFVDLFGGEIVECFEYLADKGYTSVINVPYTEWSPLLKYWKKFNGVLPDIVEKFKHMGCIDT
ncbi:MAG: hypothetical protein QW775_06940 [Ignisphaera sp.]|uniref:Uncharacterized protein n=1 Tax=Ignisphaera aggregans TaxID=334771 RepID=A0A7C4JK12_9CREN